MLHDSWDDAMLWYGSLIGYMAGVKAACKDEDRLDLLLAMASTQVKLEDVERENARLRKLVQRMWPAFIRKKRATFADRLHVKAEIDGLGVEVDK